jgi:hypothetical protein
VRDTNTERGRGKECVRGCGVVRYECGEEYWRVGSEKHYINTNVQRIPLGISAYFGRILESLHGHQESRLRKFLILIPLHNNDNNVRACLPLRGAIVCTQHHITSSRCCCKLIGTHHGHANGAGHSRACHPLRKMAHLQVRCCTIRT